MDLELDTASSERVPPPLADDNDRRGSGVGSMGATFLPPPQGRIVGSHPQTWQVGFRVTHACFESSGAAA